MSFSSSRHVRHQYPAFYWHLHTSDLETGVSHKGRWKLNTIHPGSHVQNMVLTSVVIPAQWDNITAAKGNNTFVLEDDAGPATWTVVVPDGQYDVYRLTAYLQNELRTMTPPAGATLTQASISVSYDAVSNLVTVGVLAAETFEITTSTLAVNLGFASAQRDIQVTTTTTATNHPYLLRTTSLHVVCPSVDNVGAPHSNHHKNILASIPIHNITYGDVVVFTPALPTVGVVNSVITGLDFSLVDDDGDLVDMQGRHWGCSLRVTYA